MNNSLKVVISIKKKQYITIKYNIFNSEYKFIFYNLLSIFNRKINLKNSKLYIIYFIIEIEIEITISIPVIIRQIH